MGVKSRAGAALLAGVAAACVGDCAEPEWAQWRGPNRDDVSAETGLLKQWPEGGPELAWKAGGCGKGYSSAAVAGGLLFTAGTSNEQTFVVALDLSGRLKWRAANGRRWEAGDKMPWGRNYDGARATPTVKDGAVYHLNETGTLSAFDAQSGKVLWTVDVARRFAAGYPKYGYTESLLADGDRLICTPGGSNAFMVALDRGTGEAVWANTEVREGAGFASPILVEDRGLRQIVTMTPDALVGIEAGAGKLLWRHPFANKRKNNIPTPLFRDGALYASSGYGAGSVRLDFSYPAGGGVAVTRAWVCAELDNVHGGVVLVGGRLYGASHEKPAWLCVDGATGRALYRDAGMAMGSVTCADGMLYCLGQDGTMALVRCTPERFDVVSRFAAPTGGDGQHWAHPVVCGGRLYLRHSDRLFAYRIAR